MVYRPNLLSAPGYFRSEAGKENRVKLFLELDGKVATVPGAVCLRGTGVLLHPISHTDTHRRGSNAFVGGR